MSAAGSGQGRAGRGERCPAPPARTGLGDAPPGTHLSRRGRAGCGSPPRPVPVVLVTREAEGGEVTPCFLSHHD